MRSNIDNSLLCFLDFETTGLDPRSDCAIEVAGIWTQGHKLVRVARFHSLIKPGPGFIQGLTETTVQWAMKAQGAYSVHQIHAQDVVDAPTVREVCEKWTLIDEMTKLETERGARTILVSDNAQFEHGFATELYKRAEIDFPFHYSTWDTSLLLAAVGLKKPSKLHRADSDIEGLMTAVREAFCCVEQWKDMAEQVWDKAALSQDQE